jgi:GT2 family glycosyltransferase
LIQAFDLREERLVGVQLILLQEAVGEWVWIAESDDYADSRFLEMMLAAVATRQSVGLVYCDSKIVDEKVVLTETFASIKNKKMETTRWGHDYFNEGLSEIEEYLLPNGTINNTSAVLFRKNVLIESDPFDLSLRYTGDKYAFIKVLARSNVAYVSEALNYFRNPYNTKSANKFVFYFYEQFLIFDWVYKNLSLKSKIKFFEGFHSNTRSSLFRDWGRTKLSLYAKLFYLNPSLLLNNLGYNFREGLRSVFRLQGAVIKK